MRYDGNFVIVNQFVSFSDSQDCLVQTWFISKLFFESNFYPEKEFYLFYNGLDPQHSIYSNGKDMWQAELWIRIQGFDDPEENKLQSRNFLKSYFDPKLQFTYVQAAGEAFSPQKRPHPANY